MIEGSRATQQAAAVRRVVVLVLVLNLVVAIAKGVYAAWSGSLAVALDAVHSLVDASANVVGIVALRFAQAPPDDEHPYGHAKIELLAAAGIGVLIGVATFEFAARAVSGLVHGTPAPPVPDVGFVVVGATLVINVGVAWYEHRRGKTLGSAFLQADAAHTASDVLVTIAVLASFILSRLGVTWADSACALMVTVVIGRVAWRILRDNFGALIDRAALAPADVTGTVMAIAGVTGCHRVRSRGVGAQVAVDLHITVDGELSVARAHDIAHDVEAALRARFVDLVDVTIHVEPDGDEAEGL
jgi:cation diffusion facilitator family transporter